MYFIENKLKESKFCNYKMKKTEDNSESNIQIVITEYNSEKEKINEFSSFFKKKTSKKGWCRMYHKNYADITTNIVKDNPFALVLFNYLLKNKYFKQDGTIKNFKQIDLAKKLDTTRQRISKAIKTLKQNEAIAEIDGELRYNPFMLYISNADDKTIGNAQNIWENNIGHYNFYEQ